MPEMNGLLLLFSFYRYSSPTPREKSRLGQYAVVVPALDLIVINRVDERMTKRIVHKREMAQLVRMVVDAAPRN
jgi:hypothetical protein